MVKNSHYEIYDLSLFIIQIKSHSRNLYDPMYMSSEESSFEPCVSAKVFCNDSTENPKSYNPKIAFVSKKWDSHQQKKKLF